MNPILEQLLRLQRLDTDIRALGHDLQQIPKRSKLIDEKVSSVKEPLDKVLQEKASLESGQAEMEAALKSLEDKERQLKLKMPEIRSNDEYSALLREMDATKRERDKTEDRSLKAMERLEAIEGEIPPLQESYEKGEEAVATERLALKAEQDKLSAELLSKKKERQELQTKMNPGGSGSTRTSPPSGTAWRWRRQGRHVPGLLHRGRAPSSCRTCTTAKRWCPARAASASSSWTTARKMVDLAMIVIDAGRGRVSGPFRFPFRRSRMRLPPPLIELLCRSLVMGLIEQGVSGQRPSRADRRERGPPRHRGPHGGGRDHRGGAPVLLEHQGELKGQDLEYHSLIAEPRASSPRAAATSSLRVPAGCRGRRSRI